jgi:tetratricopeptide (TPR) repeat protein
MSDTVKKTLIIAVAAGAALWAFLATTSDRQSDQLIESAPSQPPSPAAHAPVQRSPFLASHEQLTTSPDVAEEVTPSFHLELEQLRARIQENPVDTASILRLAHLLHDSHQLPDAVDAYRSYLTIVPGSRAGWIDLTRALGETGDWKTALAAVDTLLTRFPNDPSGLYNKGAILANMGERDSARSYWDLARRQHEDPGIQKMAETAIGRLDD